MLKEFKEFAIKGNMVDMAVGIIIGAAFGTVVTSLVNDVLMPRDLGDHRHARLQQPLRGPAQSVSGAAFTSVKAARDAGAVVLAFGLFLNAIIAFLAVGDRAVLPREGAQPAAAPGSGRARRSARAPRGRAAARRDPGPAAAAVSRASRRARTAVSCCWRRSGRAASTSGTRPEQELANRRWRECAAGLRDVKLERVDVDGRIRFSYVALNERDRALECLAAAARDGRRAAGAGRGRRGRQVARRAPGRARRSPGPTRAPAPPGSARPRAPPCSRCPRR